MLLPIENIICSLVRFDGLELKLVHFDKELVHRWLVIGVHFINSE